MVFLRTFLITTMSLFIFISLTEGVKAQDILTQADKAFKTKDKTRADSLLREAIYYLKNEKPIRVDTLSKFYQLIVYNSVNQFKWQPALKYIEEAYDYYLSIGEQSYALEYNWLWVDLLYNIGDSEKSIPMTYELLNSPFIDTSYTLRSYFQLAHYYSSMLKVDSAFHYSKIGIDLAEQFQDSLFLGLVYENSASIQNSLGDKEEALTLYLKALDYLQTPEKRILLCSTFRRIGYLFQSLNNEYKAEEYANKSLEIAQKYNYKRDEAFSLSLLAQLSDDLDYKMENYKKVVAYFEKMRIANELLSAYSNMASVYLMHDSISNAKVILNKCDSIYNKSVKSTPIQHYYMSKCIYYIKMNDRESAKKYLDLSVSMEDKYSIPLIVSENLKLKIFYYKNFGDYKKAFEAQTAYNAIEDSISTKQRINLVHDLEAKYLKTEQDNAIATLNIENELKATQLRQQKTFLFGGGIALGLISILSLFIFKLYKDIRSKNAIIEKSLKEKDTLLREIHHRVKNNLQVVSSLLALQSKYVIDDNALVALKQGQDRVQSMALIHQDLYEMEDMTGVVASHYFELLVENLFDSYNISDEKVDLNINIEDLVLDVDTMIPLGLITNELVSNSLKHAFKNITEGGKIDISLYEEDKQLILKVSDNGEGVESIEDIEGKSFGYELIKSFCKKLNGDISISGKGGLTTVLKIKKYKKAA